MAKAKDDDEGIQAIAKSAIGGMKTALAGLTKISSVATAGLGALTSVVGGVTSALTAPIDAIKSLADTVMGLVGLANPATVKIFTIALNDAMAVIGHGLTPILQGATIYVRALGDVMAKLMPVFRPLLSMLGQTIVNAAVGAVRIWEAMAPALEVLTDAMVTLLEQATLGFAYFQGVVIEVIKTMTALFGITSKRFNPDANSQGAAFRTASTDSVGGFAKKLFEKSLVGAFGQGGKRPEEHLPDILKEIQEGQKAVVLIKEKVVKIADWFERNTAPLANAVGTGKSVADATSSIFGVAGTVAKSLLK